MLTVLAAFLSFAAFLLLVTGLQTLRDPDRPALPWRILYVAVVIALLASAVLALRADMARCDADPGADGCGTVVEPGQI